MPAPSFPVEIHPFDPATASHAQWAAWHRFRRTQAAELRPGDPLLSDEEAEREEIIVSPLWDRRWWVALSGNTILGSAGFGFRRPDTEHAAEHAPYLNGGIGVIAPARRHGIGSTLLDHARLLMHATGKTTLTLSTFNEPGHAFIIHIGGVAKHTSVQNRANFAALDWAQLRAWEDGIVNLGLTWERHTNRVDLGVLQTLLPDFTRLIADIPLGQLDRPPIRFEIEGYRQWYETMDRLGGAHHLLVLRTEQGHVAGLTEVGWDPRTPDRAWQQLTATDRAWRGKGLARALKAAMFRQIQTHHPCVKIMITFNAESNAPMLSINRRVGFTIYRRFTEYQVTRDELDKYRQAVLL